MDRYTQSATAKILVFLAASLLTAQASALNKVQPTKLEWRALPRLCQTGGHSGFVPPRGERYASISAEEKKLLWDIGGWHYCTGVVKLIRAELGMEPKARKALLVDAHKDVGYSLQRIPRNQPLAAEIGVAMARIEHLLSHDEKALKILDELQPLHPGYSPLYTAYAAILLKSKEYSRAAEILAAGNTATGDRLGEIQYFLGIALFHAGDIEAARQYEAKAIANHYPLRYLTRLLAQHDRNSGSDN